MVDIGLIFRKIQYTYNAVKEIEAALSDKGFEMSLYALEDYAPLIRKIKTESGGSSGDIPDIQHRTTNIVIYCFNVPRNKVKTTLRRVMSPTVINNVARNYHSVSRSFTRDTISIFIPDNIIDDTKRKVISPSAYNKVQDNIVCYVKRQDYDISDMSYTQNNTKFIADNVVQTKIKTIIMEEE